MYSSNYSTTGGASVASVLLSPWAIALYVAVAVFLIYWFGFHKASMLDQTSSKLGVTSDYVRDDKPMGGIMMSPAQLANFYNLTYPPDTTKFIQKGNSTCAVSSVNNAPWDSYFKCNPNKPWSKDAIGEALALSSVGSYYVPSGPEDANLHKVVALAHDPVTWPCANANANNLPGTHPNTSLANVIPPRMRANH